MPLSLRGNAEGFDRTLCDARARLVTARRMRCDDSYDELCDLVLESIDSALEMTQSGGDEDAWRERVAQVCGAILIARLRAVDLEFDACLHEIYGALRDAGIR